MWLIQQPTFDKMIGIVWYAYLLQVNNGSLKAGNGRNHWSYSAMVRVARASDAMQRHAMPCHV
jgi:hypothetical protein